MATAAGPPTIRFVGSSQPTVARPQSQESVAASEDYYSLSDAASSSRSRVTVVPYRTPPSRNLSPSSNDAHDFPYSGASQHLAPTPEEPSPGDAVHNSGNDNNNNNTLRTASVDRQSAENSTWAAGKDTPFVRFAIEQLTRDEELMDNGRNGSVSSSEYPAQRIVTREGPRDNTTPSRQDRPKEGRTHTPSPRHSVASDILIPANTTDAQNSHPLDYCPVSLRPVSLFSLITLCLAMIAGITFCEIWARRYGGLWDYDVFGASRYFVFQYLPQVLAVPVILWTFVVQAAVYRAAPLYVMARSPHKAGVLQNMPMLSRNFVLPDSSHFRHGERTVGACLFVIWLANLFAIPLQSCLFQVSFYGPVADGGFRWTTVQGVAWTLVSLYALLAITAAALMARFACRFTGLMWDPVSIADIIPLIQNSNILHEFDRSEVSLHVERHISLPPVRLGYWWDSLRQHILYGIGFEGQSCNQTYTTEDRDYTGDNVHPDVDVEQLCLNAKGSFEKALHSPFSRCRWAPWFLRDTSVVAWIAVVSVLTVAFVAVSFINRPILKGFLPLLPTLTSDSGFSSSNFLFSFVPSFIGTVLFLAWQPIDVYFRAIQSYAELSLPDGAPAEASLTLRYSSGLPLEVTISALVAGHYKVGYISFIGIVTAAVPILAGGVFLARFYPEADEIRMSTHLPAYYTLMGFVILYALSFLIIWPRRKRYLPHPLVTYADVISFLYQSPLLTDETFGALVTGGRSKKRAAALGESKRHRYAFGIYRGLDGQEHLGIDRLTRSDMLEV